MFPLSLTLDNLDPVPSSSSTSSSNESPSKTPIPFSMSGDGTDDVTIPAVFMKKGDASVLRELLWLEKSVYVLLTWIPQEMGETDDRGKEGVVNSLDSSKESISGESGLYDSGMESNSQSNQELRSEESGLYDNRMDSLESDHEQRHRDSVQTCSSTAGCNSPSDSP